MGGNSGSGIAQPTLTGGPGGMQYLLNGEQPAPITTQPTSQITPIGGNTYSPQPVGQPGQGQPYPGAQLQQRGLPQGFRGQMTPEMMARMQQMRAQGGFRGQIRGQGRPGQYGGDPQRAALDARRSQMAAQGYPASFYGVKPSNPLFGQ